eukprot:gene5450-9263_t
MWLFKSLSGQKEATEDIDSFKQTTETQEKRETSSPSTSKDEVNTPVILESSIPVKEEQKKKEDNFVEEMTPEGGKVSQKAKLDVLFKRYMKASNDEEEITAEGIFLFASDIEIDPMKVDLLVVFWKLNCKQQYTITKDEFINGFTNLGLITLSELTKGVPKLKDQFKHDKKSFSKFYKFVFDYSKPNPNAKVLPIEIAVPTWKLLLEDRYNRVDDFLDFIENEFKKSVSKDLWDQLLRFMDEKEIGSINFEEEAWPIAIEDFVTFLKNKNKI